MFTTERTTVAPDWKTLLGAGGLTDVASVYACNAGTVVTQSGTTQVRRVTLGEGAATRTVFIKKYWVTSAR